MEMVLADLSPKSLAEMLQVQMFQMMCLAQLFQVNAFDQPNVEDYKTETRRFLQSGA
jgi:glucose-6-phosphate isomerase